MEEKEQLEKLVKESESLAEILRKQGKATSGAALKILKNKLDEYEIDYHFIKFKNIPKKLDSNEFFSENSSRSGRDIRKRLIQESNKEYICSICGQKPE